MLPWGSISGAAVSVLTCGKVVGKSSGLDRDCGLQDKAEGKEKKHKFRMWENFYSISILAPRCFTNVHHRQTYS